MGRERRSQSIQFSEGMIARIDSSSSDDDPSSPKVPKRPRPSSSSSSSEKRKRARPQKLQIGISSGSQSPSFEHMLRSSDSVNSPAKKEDQPDTPTSKMQQLEAVSGGNESPPKDLSTMAEQKSPDAATDNPAAGAGASSSGDDSLPPLSPRN